MYLPAERADIPPSSRWKTAPCIVGGKSRDWIIILMSPLVATSASCRLSIGLRTCLFATAVDAPLTPTVHVMVLILSVSNDFFFVLSVVIHQDEFLALARKSVHICVKRQQLNKS